MKYDQQHQQILDTAIGVLREKLPALVAVIVFGSFGTNYERKESDLDLGILTDQTDEPTDVVKLWEISQEIATIIGRDVDVIDLRRASTVFCFQILTTGHPVYCSNDLILAHFDTLIISMYLRLQEERKDILDDYEKGIFYG